MVIYVISASSITISAFMVVAKGSHYTNKKRIEEIKFGSSKLAVRRNESGSVREIQYYTWRALNNINIHDNQMQTHMQTRAHPLTFANTLI